MTAHLDVACVACVVWRYGGGWCCGNQGRGSSHFTLSSPRCLWSRDSADDADGYRLFLFGFSDSVAPPPYLGAPVRSGAGWSPAADSGEHPVCAPWCIACWRSIERSMVAPLTVPWVWAKSTAPRALPVHPFREACSRRRPFARVPCHILIILMAESSVQSDRCSQTCV